MTNKIMGWLLMIVCFLGACLVGYYYLGPR